MSSIVIAGDTSGSVTLQAPAVAGSTVLNLPSTSGTIQTSGAGYTTNGVAYASSTSALTTGSALTYNGTDLKFASGSGLFTNTSDGSDTATLAIGGGGANSSARGSVIEFYGNENASAGVLDITSGNVANSYVRIQGRSSTSYVRFDINASEQMRLTSTGLGIGTSSPSYKLDVSSSAISGVIANFQATAANTYSTLRLTGNSRGGEVDFYNGATAQAAIASNTGNLYFYTNGNSTLQATLDSAGNLLVGTTSAGARVYAVASGAQQAVRGDQSTAGAAAFYGVSSVNSGTGYVAYFTNSGSGTGLYISNTAAWQSTSDERLKTDIQDLDATARLLQLRPRDYLWKSQETSDEPSKRSFGFIAQEVKEVFPELVGVSPDGMFSVEYTGLIAPLVKAIQEQQALINTLTDRITALEGV